MVRAGPPVIGLTTDVLPVGHRRKYTLYNTYVESVRSAGGLPVAVPPGTPEAARGILVILDALLLPGGDDLHPRHWGEREVHPAVILSAEERSLFELALVRDAVREGVPLLGICLGCQTLNVALGGTVEQHLDPALGHGGGSGRAEAGTHEVLVEEGTRLGGLIGSGRVRVNSGHHQAVGRLGEGLRVSARGDDGVVEAVEGTGPAFVVGVQWHPEERPEDPVTRALFEGLVESARARRP